MFSLIILNLYLQTFVIKFSSVMHLVIKQIKRMDDEYSNPVSQLNFLIQNLPELRILEIGGRFMPKTLIEDTVAKNCHNLKIFKFPAAVYRRKAMNLRDIFKDVPQLQVAAMEDEYFGYHTYYPVYDLLGEEIKSDDDDNFYTEDLGKFI